MSPLWVTCRYRLLRSRGCGHPVGTPSNGPLPLPPKVERAVTRTASGEAVARAQTGQEVGRPEARHVERRHRLEPRHAYRLRIGAHLVGKDSFELTRERAARPAVEHGPHERRIEPLGARTAHVECDAAVGVTGLGALVTGERCRGVHGDAVPDVGD